MVLFSGKEKSKVLPPVWICAAAASPLNVTFLHGEEGERRFWVWPPAVAAFSAAAALAPAPAVATLRSLVHMCSVCQ